MAVLLVALCQSAHAEVDFNRDIRPVLSNNCFKCHGPDEEQREADLRLDSAEGATADLGGYRAIEPGDPDASEAIIRVITDDVDLLMPPADSGLKLTEQQIDSMRQWVRLGAKYEQHWAFTPIVRPPLPAVKCADWVRNPIDQFVLAALEAGGIDPSPEADRRALVRRVYLDLLGLPPSLEELDALLDDESADAYGRMVDRVLASPHYGERWGRYWLDQARYADTNGYTIDSQRSISPYRDWVIDALNRDLPFDQFTIQQLAGDLLEGATPQQVIATGFHRNTLVNQEGGADREQFRNEAVVDRVNTTGSVWLGLTIGCAQCHNHKYDPISQRDYYQLFAFFNSSQDANSTTPTIRVAPDEMQQKLTEFDRQIAAAKADLKQYDAQKPDPGRAELAAALEKVEDEKKRFAAAIPSTMVMAELDNPRDTHVLIRGDFLRKGDPVQPDVPAALPPLPDSENRRSRLDLARWLVDRDNPLTARVTVNRVWMRYFGRGLVETENDFGIQGTPPTHPQLLDWLAADFIDGDWSMKRLHRLIVTSAVYRQSSHARPDLQMIDPLNRLLARQSRQRVNAETVRDLGLAVSGLLSHKIGGPSVYPPQPDGVYAFTQRRASWPTSTGPDRYRRGMYTFFMRSAPYPMLTTFDTPRFNKTCTRRVRSNTPLQSLTMANDQAIVEVAQAFARRLLDRTCENDRQRIHYAFRLCFARSPDEAEVGRLNVYLADQRSAFTAAPEDARALAGDNLPDEVSPAEAAAWVAVARVLINLDEFITRE